MTVISSRTSRKRRPPHIRICRRALGPPPTDPWALRSQRVASTSCRAPARSRERACPRECRCIPPGSQIGCFIWLVCLRAPDGHGLHAGLHIPRCNSSLGRRGRCCGSGRDWLGGWLLGWPTGQVATPVTRPRSRSRARRPSAYCLSPTHASAAISSWILPMSAHEGRDCRLFQ